MSNFVLFVVVVHFGVSSVVLCVVFLLRIFGCLVLCCLLFVFVQFGVYLCFVCCLCLHVWVSSVVLFVVFGVFVGV